MTTYRGIAGDRLYGGRNAPVRSPALATISWPPESALTIPSVESVNAPAHPKVLDTGGWNGYRYWMAFTPYPLTSNADEVENPSIVASNDGSTWVAPATNPIVPAPDGVQQARNYNSDPHLVLLGGVMYLIWRHATHTTNYGGTTVETLLYKTSTNGTTWGPDVLMLQKTHDDFSGLLSPCVEYWGGLWWMWVYSREFDLACHLYTAPTINGPWAGPTICDLSINSGDKEIWHFDVIRIPNGWAHLLADRGGTVREHWLTYSADGINWEPPHRFTAGDLPNVYRSSFVRTATGYDCWINDWDDRTIRRTQITDAQV